MSDSWFNIRAKIEIESSDKADSSEKAMDMAQELTDEDTVCSVDTFEATIFLTMEAKPPHRDQQYLRDRIVDAADKVKAESVHVTFDEEFVWYAKSEATV